MFFVCFNESGEFCTASKIINMTPKQYKISLIIIFLLKMNLLLNCGFTVTKNGILSNLYNLLSFTYNNINVYVILIYFLLIFTLSHILSSNNCVNMKFHFGVNKKVGFVEKDCTDCPHVCLSVRNRWRPSKWTLIKFGTSEYLAHISIPYF